jgi:stage II sporulation protein AA (anti-sigma F factor antagonist)
MREPALAPTLLPLVHQLTAVRSHRGAQMKVVDGPGWRRLELSGEIDLAWYESHRADVELALEDIPRLIFVDVERVTFMDSTGIGVLAKIYRQSQIVEGEVCVVCPRPFVARTLEIAGLDDVLTIVDSASEAWEIYAGVARLGGSATVSGTRPPEFDSQDG